MFDFQKTKTRQRQYKDKDNDQKTKTNKDKDKDKDENKDKDKDKNKDKDFFQPQHLKNDEIKQLKLLNEGEFNEKTLQKLVTKLSSTLYKPDKAIMLYLNQHTRQLGGYPGGVLYTQYRSTGHSTQIFFAANWGHGKELLFSNGGGCYK